MALLHIAILGSDPEPILTGLRHFGGGRLVLVGPSDARQQFDKVAEGLRLKGVTAEFEPFDGEPLVGTIRAMERIARSARERKEDPLLNLGCADRGMACAGLSAAFVAGVKAFDIVRGKVVILPVLQFSYRELVSDAKVRILRALHALGGESSTLKDLSEKAGVLNSLTSYHIRGGRDAKGLEELGLVTVDRGERGALTIRLTPMGELLATGLGV